MTTVIWLMVRRIKKRLNRNGLVKYLYPGKEKARDTTINALTLVSIVALSWHTNPRSGHRLSFIKE